MKTLFKKMLAGVFLATLFLNVKAQNWTIPTIGSAVGTTTNWLGTTTGSNPLRIFTNGNESMRITSTGLVGIGTSTTDPLSPLQVGSGTSKVSIGGVGGFGPYIGFNAAYAGGNWQIAGDGDEAGGAAIQMDEDGSMVFSTTDIGDLSNQTLSNATFGATYQRMRIDGPSGQVSILADLTVGRVLIGSISTTPSGYKLYVDDGILTEKIKVGILGTASWADFVFDKSYKLMPLSEVKKYIDKNKHLPDVPSAEEMVDNGLDVATMDAKLLQKIEELTLYMIEMKEQSEEMKKENKEMKEQNEKLAKEVELLKAKK